ncbi:hypothetical protein M422DRAFT_268810, partial [Sphaerobolus stellatus SS14]
MDIDKENLNDSQHEVVLAMLEDSSITLVHGPPGTGKTTVISKAAEVWSDN